MPGGQSHQQPSPGWFCADADLKHETIRVGVDLLLRTDLFQVNHNKVYGSLIDWRDILLRSDSAFLVKQPNTYFKSRIKIASHNRSPQTCDNCSTYRQADTRPASFSISSRTQSFILFKNPFNIGFRNTRALVPDYNFNLFTLRFRDELSNNLNYRVTTRIMDRIINNIIQHHLH